MALKIVYPFYNNHAAMDSLLPRIASLPCEVVVVDDASDPPLGVSCQNVRVMRIEVDVPWNQPAASNLGIRSLSPSDVVLRLDIDHWVDPSDFSEFESCSLGLPTRTLYQFVRVSSTGKRLHPNMNMLMMRVSDFLRIGCYDEDFCGSYGYDDKEFVDRARHMGYKVEVSARGLLRVEVDAGTRNLSRDASVNKAKYLRKLSERRGR